MKFLSDVIQFPNHNEASEDGLLAVGADLSLKRLIYAYSIGVFPWFENEEPILWWSPDPRFVLFPNELKVSKSMKQFMRISTFQITQNKAFSEVVDNCSKVMRPGQRGTWITQNMKLAYNELYEAGFAKSVEVWDQEQLVGGIYGVDLNNGVFCGESMFSLKSNASKFAFTSLIENGSYNLIDCQVHTNHLESLGARFISRRDYLRYLLP
ncbi:leucyl/phenylalanyl-tRNA--protein transferase [Paucihalobacter sp.]|uniref:leucyl/phenylalanyl-tRNA--protein transferase n=1 Tax=Paucihalobacter sp. TaxID=2850405 RepID=UPI002FE2E6DA